MEKTLLLLLRDAMKGTAPTAETVAQVKACTEPEKLLQLSELHNILPLVGPLFLEARPDYPETQKLRQYIRTHVVRQIMALDALCRVTAAFEKQQVQYLVIKGAACRALYPRPEHRPSTDEDILVAPEDLEHAAEVFASLGYTRGQEEPEAQVHHFTNPMLHVELHQTLIRRQGLNKMLMERLKEPLFFAVEGRKLRTLPHQEHFLFLAEHFYKHFIHGGVGIRQVADMVLMAQQPGICWEETWAQLEEMELEILICGVLEIGIAHLGLREDAVEIPMEIRKRSPGPELLLEDILDAGAFGGSTMERRHSSSVTVQAVQGETGQTSLLKTLFPGAKQLSGRYSYLKRKPWLLPVAWGSRIIGYLREDKGAGKRAMESVSMGKQRMALMKQYGILK